MVSSLLKLSIYSQEKTKLQDHLFNFFSDHGKGIDMDVPLTTRELRSMMDNICEVEKCMGKILELKDAFGKLNDYSSEQKSEGAILLMNSAAQKI